jgi:hypothetical protein
MIPWGNAAGAAAHTAKLVPHPDQAALSAGNSRYDFTDPESVELTKAALATLRNHPAHGWLNDTMSGRDVGYNNDDHLLGVYVSRRP